MRLNKESRQKEIIESLKAVNGLTVKKLSKKFDVSEMTIRRDLKELEADDIISNFHGIAVYNQQPKELNKIPAAVFPYTITDNEKLMEQEKFAIGKKAATLVQEDDVIAIDIGTTTEKFTQHIPTDLHFSALVYSANNLLHLLPKSKATILLAGGQLHRGSGMFQSSEELSLIDNTRTTKFFLSAAGIHENLGITCANPYEDIIKKKAIANSAEIILLVDSSKLGKVSTSFVCDLADIDKVIIDQQISQKWQQIFEKNNVAVLIADDTST